jgi:uncharacterized protein YcsI (UPF0317 family)
MHASEAAKIGLGEAGMAVKTPFALRQAIRCGAFDGPTAGQAPGFLQGNLAIVPSRDAADFLRYCVRNPKPCPIIGVSEPGSPQIPELGLDIDLRSDLSGYRVFQRGQDGFRRMPEIHSVWRDDLVALVLGCSFSFEDAVMRAGIPVRHIQAGRNVPMYVTTLDTRPAGRFHGPMVVSMRAFAPADAVRAIVLSEAHPLAHGAPVHIGDPAKIGIADLMQPDFGHAPVIEPGDIPVFWACGVTPQLAIRNAAPDLAITHEPGHMLVTDIPAEAAQSILAGGTAFLRASE